MTDLTKQEAQYKEAYTKLCDSLANIFNALKDTGEKFSISTEDCDYIATVIGVEEKGVMVSIDDNEQFIEWTDFDYFPLGKLKSGIYEFQMKWGVGFEIY